MNHKELVLQYMEKGASDCLGTPISFDDGREAIYDILRENNVFILLAEQGDHGSGPDSPEAHMYKLADEPDTPEEREEHQRLMDWFRNGGTF